MLTKDEIIQIENIARRNAIIECVPRDNILIQIISQIGNINTLVTKTNNYTVTTSDRTVIGNTISGNLIFSLPTAIGNTVEDYRFPNIGSNDLVIQAYGTEGIYHEESLQSSVTVEDGESLSIVSDGSNWVII